MLHCVVASRLRQCGDSCVAACCSMRCSVLQTSVTTWDCRVVTHKMSRGTLYATQHTLLDRHTTNQWTSGRLVFFATNLLLANPPSSPPVSLSLSLVAPLSPSRYTRRSSSLSCILSLLFCIFCWQPPFYRGFLLGNLLFVFTSNFPLLLRTFFYNSEFTVGNLPSSLNL